MSSGSVFRGVLRSVPAVAATTVRAHLRDRTVLVLVVLFLLFVAFYRSEGDVGTRAAVARFLDYGFSGLLALLIFAGLFLAVGGARLARPATPGEELVRRQVGEAAWYWGRLGGVTLLLCVLGLGLSGVLALHVAARFGEVAGEALPLRRQVISKSFSSPSDARFLRAVGDRATLEFDDPLGRGMGRLLVGRFAPRLALAREGGSLRSSYPLRLTALDDSGRPLARTTLRVHAGKPLLFDMELPPGVGRGSLRLEIEKVDAEYLVRIEPQGLVLFGESRSFNGGLLLAGLQAALYAAVLAAFASFGALRTGPAPALLLAVAVALLATSLGVLETGVLRDLDPGRRGAALDTVRLVLPDLERHDVAAALGRGRAPGVGETLGLLGRGLATALFFGVVAGGLGRMGGGRR